MEFYDFPYILNVIIPTDELHHFSEGEVKTTNQYFNDVLFKTFIYCLAMFDSRKVEIQFISGLQPDAEPLSDFKYDMC